MDLIILLGGLLLGALTVGLLRLTDRLSRSK
jgi:hypothetical protein